jgi:hypothetical protein
MAVRVERVELKQGVLKGVAVAVRVVEPQLQVMSTRLMALLFLR